MGNDTIKDTETQGKGGRRGREGEMGRKEGLKEMGKGKGRKERGWEREGNRRERERGKVCGRWREEGKGS